MLKQILLAAAIATPAAMLGADNVNVMPWVNGTEWPSTSVEKRADGSYTVSMTQDWAGAGVDFATEHPDFQLDGFEAVHIDVTAGNGGQKMVYVNYTDGSFNEHGNQGQSGTYYFDKGKQVAKIVFKFEGRCTQTMKAFTLIAPSDNDPVEIASGNWKMNDGHDWSCHDHSVPASAFADINAGEVMRIHFNASQNAQGQAFAPRVPVEEINDDNDLSKTLHFLTNQRTYSDLSQGDSPVSVTLTEEMVTHLKARGLVFRGHDVTFTKVEILKPNPTVDVADIPEPELDPVTPSEGLGGTPIGVAPRNDLRNLFDDNASTRFSGAHADRAWSGLDLGQPYVIKKVKWMAADNEAWKVCLGVFEGANNPDFSDAVPFHIIRTTNGAGQWNEAEVSCSRGFRYVRYVGPRRLLPNTGNNGNGEDSYCEGSHGLMAELRFFGEPGEGDDSNLYRLTNLPTVIINTVDMEEPWDRHADPDKEHQIPAQFSVIDVDGNFVSAVGETKERGNYSRAFPKRPIRMKYTKKNKPVAAAAATKKKWELLNNYGDKTLMRNLVAFEISRLLGAEWTPFCTPVDLIINGEYRGCYQLADSKEVDKNRLNIHEMTLEEAQAGGEALTGGYFMEVDAYANQEDPRVWFETNRGYSIPVTVKAPKDDDVLFQCDAPLNYIKEYFSEVSARLRDGKFSGEGSYREMFDTESFLQLLMTNEIGGNKDVMWSFNMYKELGDPHIYSGPTWDYDVAFDNSKYIEYQAFDNNSWLYLNTPSFAGEFQKFTTQVLSDPATVQELKELWGAARDNGLTYENLASFIDNTASQLGASQTLNFERWPILGIAVHDNKVARGSYQAEVDHIKDFCRKIISHYDNKIGYEPGKYAAMPALDIKEDNSSLKVSTSLGKLWVKDEIIGEVEPAAAPTLRAADNGSQPVAGFTNSGKAYEFSKENLAESHRITLFAKHAGRTTPVESFVIKADGTVSAVETIEAAPAEELPALYFNMQGVQVDPQTTAPGVYIRRQGTKVSKIVLR